jgi:hypothetical protein
MGVTVLAIATPLSTSGRFIVDAHGISFVVSTIPITVSGSTRSPT